METPVLHQDFSLAPQANLESLGPNRPTVHITLHRMSEKGNSNLGFSTQK